MTVEPLDVAVFASGSGTNFQALLDHAAGQSCWRISLLVMNRAGRAAERAARAGIPVRIIPTRDRDGESLGLETLEALEQHGIDVVVLAGYLRHVPEAVTRRYAGRILNIHPALLPEFGGPGMYGMNVHRAVLASDAAVSGATVHFVTEAYDEGDILGQWRVERLPDDTPESLSARVLAVEHELYPRAVDHLCAALRRDEVPKRMPDVWLDEPPAGRGPRVPHESHDDRSNDNREDQA